jgi:transcriptional regulator with XRE-family HTH domain
MEVALEVRMKSGALLRYLERNEISIRDFATIIGVSYTTACAYVSFRQIPREDVQKKIANLLKMLPEDIFPPKAIKENKKTFFKEMPILPEQFYYKQITSGDEDDIIEREEKRNLIQVLMGSLRPIEQHIFNSVFIEEKSLKETGRELDEKFPSSVVSTRSVKLISMLVKGIRKKLVRKISNDDSLLQYGHYLAPHINSYNSNLENKRNIREHEWAEEMEERKKHEKNLNLELLKTFTIDKEEVI